MRLSDAEVWALAKMILTVDGGCGVCVPALLGELQEVFPADARRLREAALTRCEEWTFMWPERLMEVGEHAW